MCGGGSWNAAEPISISRPSRVSSRATRCAHASDGLSWQNRASMSIRSNLAMESPSYSFMVSACGSAHWAPLLERLTSYHRVALDQPGHGGTSRIDFRGVNLRRWYREMLTAVLDQLGIESAHLVGHSQGAMQALWLALDAPERVKSVIAIGTPAVAFGAALPGLQVLARPGVGAVMLGMPKPPGPYRRILEGTIGAGAVAHASDDLIRATYLATRAPGYGATVSRYLREMFRGPSDGTPEYVLNDDELAQIEQPILVVMGQGDRIQSPGEITERVSPLPQGRLEWVPGDHEPWLDDIDGCARVVAAALS